MSAIRADHGLGCVIDVGLNGFGRRLLLWLATRTAATASTGGRSGGGGGGFRCGATTSFTAAQTPYPDDAHDAISSDTDGTIRAWMGVLSYLLADGRFFLQ